jgi:hypothetical protein
MRRAALIAVAAALALSACDTAEHNRATAGGGVGGICKAFPQGSAATAAAGDPSFAIDDCLHRWGYTLARASDGADVVAGAVVAACNAPLARWNQQTMSTGQAQEAPSLITGETTNPIAAHASFAEGRALFYVVQARAGKCEPPRVEARTGEASTAATSPDR